MTRLIYDDALTADILALGDCTNGYSNSYDKACIIGIIEEQPTADAVPVVHSYWRTVHMSEQTGYDPTLASYVDPVYGHVCAVCGADAIVNDTGDEVLTIYCPDCGARMDGES